MNRPRASCEGGNDCGDEIVARLVDAPVDFDAYRRPVRYQKTPADLDPYLDTWDPSFKTLGEGAPKFDERFFEIKNDDGVRTVTPKGPRFRGQVVVLISPTNSSATFQFASAMRRHRLATLIGEPTGGNQRGINGGAYFFLHLPNSGLEADLPLIAILRMRTNRTPGSPPMSSRHGPPRRSQAGGIRRSRPPSPHSPPSVSIGSSASGSASPRPR
jgi:hypothetical protein